MRSGSTTVPALLTRLADRFTRYNDALGWYR